MMNFKNLSGTADHLNMILSKAEKLVVPAIANEFLKDSNYYVPFDTGATSKSAILNSDLPHGIIVWETPYARRIFYGYMYNFSKDSNPNATYEWAEKAKIRNAQKYKKMAVKIMNEVK